MRKAWIEHKHKNGTAISGQLGTTKISHHPAQTEQKRSRVLRSQPPRERGGLCLAKSRALSCFNFSSTHQRARQAQATAVLPYGTRDASTERSSDRCRDLSRATILAACAPAFVLWKHKPYLPHAPGYIPGYTQSTYPTKHTFESKPGRYPGTTSVHTPGRCTQIHPDCMTRVGVPGYTQDTY